MTRRRLVPLLLGAMLLGNLAPIRIWAAPQTITLQPGESVTIVAEGGAPSPSPSPSSGPPSPVPSSATFAPSPPASTPTPTVAPSPSPTTAPSPAPTAPPTSTPPSSTPCGSLQARITAAPTGSTLDLTGCTYTTGATVSKALTITGGTIRQSGTALTITGNDVTVNGVAFDGGSQTVNVNADRFTLTASTFVNMRESSIRLQPGSDDVLVSGNTITQTINTGHGYSPVACNDGGKGVGTFNRVTFRDNTIDQGPSGVAWFGIECWGVGSLVISGNTLRGTSALISIPRSDGALIEGNNFGGGFYWGAELSDVSDAIVRDNTVTGNGATGDGRAFVQLHPGSGTSTNVTITGNRVSNEWALLNAAGSGHTITGNCGGWTKLYAYTFSGPVTISGNGACP